MFVTSSNKKIETFKSNSSMNLNSNSFLNSVNNYNAKQMPNDYKQGSHEVTVNIMDSFDLENTYIRVDSPMKLGKAAIVYEACASSTMNFNQKANHQFEMFQSTKAFNNLNSRVNTNAS